MPGILKGFKPLLKNNVHDQFDGNWKFIVTIDENGTLIEGEGWAKNESGSKNWTEGAMHDYEKVSSQYAHNSTKFKGLKIQENTATPSNVSTTGGHYDFERESYVISRFSHTFALDYLNSLPEKESTKMKEDHGREVIGKLAESIAKSVYRVAKVVRTTNEAGN